MKQFMSSCYQREVGSNPSSSVMLSGRASAQTKNPVSRVMGSIISLGSLSSSSYYYSSVLKLAMNGDLGLNVIKLL